MNKWNQLADKETVKKTIASLKANNIDARFVQTGDEAKKEIYSLIPEGSEVMTMSSTTLDALEISKEINESSKFNSVKNKLNEMNRETQNLDMQKLGAAPEWAIGSAHAVTEDGHVLIASNTASQLSAYAAGSPHVIWVVGTQKIVKDTDEGMKRLYDYVLPLESARLNKQYNMTAGSFVSKILIVNREFMKDRVTVIFVNEKLGF